jgi:hypothetical protein
MSLVYPQKVTLYQVGDYLEGASFNNFLDALDGSYCTYDGGDDPTQDSVYPDPSGTGYGVYKGPENCGGLQPLMSSRHLMTTMKPILLRSTRIGSVMSI